MDQRVDNERRPDSERLESPARRAPPSFDEAGDATSWRQRLRRRRGFVPLLVIGGIIAAALLVGWWLHARNYESTDDAFIDSRTVQISAQVAAAIINVPVTDNQLVDAGAELVRLDDRDYVAQRDQAQAQVNQAQASVDNLTAQIVAQQAKVDQANKQVVQAQAALTFAHQQADRYRQLASKGSGTVEQAQQYESNLQQSDAGLAAAQANATATDKQIGVLQAQLDLAFGQLAQASATLEQAQTNLARTIVTAPVAGRVTKLTAARGGYAAVGQALMIFVPRDVWVTANF
jgi:membrane fusion protein (multidrug efflux system)